MFVVCRRCFDQFPLLGRLHEHASFSRHSKWCASAMHDCRSPSLALQKAPARKASHQFRQTWQQQEKSSKRSPRTAECSGAELVSVILPQCIGKKDEVRTVYHKYHHPKAGTKVVQEAHPCRHSRSSAEGVSHHARHHLP